MNDLEKLELINTMEFIGDDADGEICNYVLVEDNKVNRDILNRIGFSDEYIKLEELDVNEGEIDIAPIAFKFCNWWFGDYFGDNEDTEAECESLYTDLWVNLKYTLEGSEYCKQIRETDHSPAFGTALCNKCIEKECRFASICVELHEMNKEDNS